jgi:probable DNA metabolism protein
MDVQAKLEILADAAKYDASCASSGSKSTRAGSKLGSTEGTGICHSYTPDGRCVSLLKILLTNYCIFDCQYCINRVTSDTPRARFSIEEVVRLTIQFYQRNYVEGLFLSSGIIQNADYTMEQMTAVARSLRQDHKFGGYIHLKSIPGAADELLAEAGRWADRLSVNIELPTPADLKKLAPEKKEPEIVAAMGSIKHRIDDYKTEKKAGFKVPRFAPAGQSTQMIVGATPTPDREILKTASSLYGQQKLRRVYYSAFSPIPHADARLPGSSPPLVREHRLYQADWLLRFYGFSVEEIVTEHDANLALDIDPKLAWALVNRDFFPVDVNKASREELLRIPGIGSRSVGKILKTRRYRRMTVADLKKMRVAWKRAAPFVIALDHNPALRHLDDDNLRDRFVEQPKQLLLFGADSVPAQKNVEPQSPPATSSSVPNRRPQTPGRSGRRQQPAQPVGPFILPAVVSDKSKETRFVSVADFSSWRSEARRLIQNDVPPSEIVFREPSERGLFDIHQAELSEAGGRSAAPFHVPGEFVELAKRVACHRDSDRWERLYRALWRITHGEKHLLQLTGDTDTRRLTVMANQVRRDRHKMKAFVRFRRIETEEGEHFVAWHRPDHRIVQLTAPFFARRFPSMRWSILTPHESATWDLKKLHFGPGVPASDGPKADELEDLWKTYYGSIFNPARIKLAAMTREMPARHWATLPETAIIPDLLADAQRRVELMIKQQEGFATSAADFFPQQQTVDALRHAASACRGCDLHTTATQTVFGEGPSNARMVLIGEQPGDCEDIAGRPFSGPAGEVLNDALASAGINREQVYVTNAVKHFKYTPRGKKRLHQRPDAREMAACKPWVEAELALIGPEVVVCLGATAAKQVIGPEFRVSTERGQFIPSDYCGQTLATWHPSAILRAPRSERRDEMQSQLVADLQLAASRLASTS